MNNNIISSYMNYKLNRLKSYFFIFLPNDKLDLLEMNATAYLTNYIKVYYYHLLETVNYSDTLLFDQKTIEEEFNGKKLELLDNLKDQELILSNEEFLYAKELITVTYNIALLITVIDRFRFSDKEEIDAKIKSLRENPSINNFFSDKIEQVLIKELKETYLTETKFFSSIAATNFELKYLDIKESEELKILDLNYSIKQLTTNYKDKLVLKTFNEDVLSLPKTEVIIKHISKEILLKTINKDKINQVFIIFDESIFTKKINTDNLFKSLDNKLLKENVNILITYNTYINNKIYLEKYSSYHFSCLQDLSHINDVTLKLNNLEATNFFDYIIINDYKHKDKAELDKYETTFVKKILFFEGD